MSFIEFQNISPRLLVLGPSYLLESMSNSIMNHNLRTKSRIFPNKLRKLIVAVKALTRISREFSFAVSKKLVHLTKEFLLRCLISLMLNRTSLIWLRTCAKIYSCKSVIHRDFSASFPLYLKCLKQFSKTHRMIYLMNSYLDQILSNCKKEKSELLRVIWVALISPNFFNKIQQS